MISKLLFESFDALEWADRVLCSSFVYRWPRDLVLDMVLGPAEDFKHVSTTTPQVAPDS